MSNREKIRKAINEAFEIWDDDLKIDKIMQIIEPTELERNDLMEGDYISDEGLNTLNEAMKDQFFGQMKGAQDNE